MSKKTNRKNMTRAVVAVLSLSAVVAMPGTAMAAPVAFADSVRARVNSSAEDAGADTDRIYVARVNEYLSVFEEESIDSELQGRLYRGAAAYVVKTDGDWSYITSGSVSGWVCSDYLVTGEEAEDLLDIVNPRVANTTAVTLNVRADSDINSAVIAQVEEGTDLVVTGSTEEWWRVRLTNDTVGYISKDFADVETGLYTAVTTSTENAMKSNLKDWTTTDTEEEDTSDEEEVSSSDDEEEADSSDEAEDTSDEQEEEEEEEETEAPKKSESKSEDEDESEWVSLGTFKTTAYCPCSRCNGGNAGKTATGAKPVAGTTIAVDSSVIPLGSKIKINGHVYTAQDTGVRGKTIDILFSEHSDCNDYGVQYEEVYILKD